MKKHYIQKLSILFIITAITIIVHSCKKANNASINTLTKTTEINISELKALYNSDTTASKLKTAGINNTVNPYIIYNQNIKWDNLNAHTRATSTVAEFEMETDKY